MKYKIIKNFDENEFTKLLEEFVDTHNVEDIKFNAIKNFLPQTNMGEFQEVFYALVSYKE